MSHKSLLTEEAERNLEEIGDYISLDNPAKAHETILRLRARITGLADFPKCNRVRENLGGDR